MPCCAPQISTFDQKRLADRSSRWALRESLVRFFAESTAVRVSREIPTPGADLRCDPSRYQPLVSLQSLVDRFRELCCLRSLVLASSQTRV